MEIILFNVDGANKLKPVRRPNNIQNTSSTSSDYLPCKYCFGMFKKQFLYRHIKKCTNNEIKTEKRNKAQSDGQNLLLSVTDHCDQLEKNVFPRIAADQISFVAKSDSLIAQ